MKIAQVSLNDENYIPLSNITFHDNKVHYCARHGYEAILKTGDFKLSPMPKMLSFEKIAWIIDLFEEKPYLDWIHWTGADTLVTNFNTKLEDIIDDTYHFIICADINELNADSFLVKNSRVGLGFLKWIMSVKDIYEKRDWQEQWAMIDFYHQAPCGKDIIKVLPQRVMNSYLYELYEHYKNTPHVDKTGQPGTWQPGDFMLHLPAVSLRDRIRLMTEYNKKVVR
jgi:hypothetical protein